MPTARHRFGVGLVLVTALLAGRFARAAPSAPFNRCASDELRAQVDEAATRLAPRVRPLPVSVLRAGLSAFFHARCLGEVRRDILSIIDFTLPSTARRLWVLDVARAAVLFETRVAHGRGSGEQTPAHFSDTPESRATSLGLFVTGSTYYGKHGYSLLLDGHEPGVNGHARERGIVVHAADYMTDRFIEAHGRAGRSFGCPALDPSVTRSVIDTIKDGTALWAYYPDSRWLASSRYLVDR